MRGPFNKQAAFVYGPRSPFGPPGTIRLSPVPSRKVEQVEIEQMQFPYTLANHWATFDLVVPNVPLTYTPFIGITYEDWCQADVIYYLDEPDVGFLAVRAEQIVPEEGGPYWRALLVPLDALTIPPWPPLAPLPPLPPPPPPPPPPPVVAPTFTCLAANEYPFDVELEVPVLTAVENWWYVEIPAGPIRVTVSAWAGGPTPILEWAYADSCGSIPPFDGTAMGDGSWLEASPGATRVYFHVAPFGGFNFDGCLLRVHNG